jgi:hypothetical protein
MIFETADSSKKALFVKSGYYVFENILDRPIVEELIQVTDGLLRDCSNEERELHRYQGSNIGIRFQHRVFPRLFAWPKALEALRSLGFDKPKFWSAFLLSKPPHAPPLYWHQDWWAWDDPISSSEVSPQVFLMYYLTDTSPQNGCLRVIPGTHLHRIPFHDLLPTAHTDATYRASQDSPIFADPPGAVDVAVKAGDLVIGDARLLHAAHANQTDHPRTCLTLWYMPAYAMLPEPIQASIVASIAGQGRLPLEMEGSQEARKMEPLIPSYSGNAEPAAWNRIPGEYLRVLR